LPGRSVEFYETLTDLRLTQEQADALFLSDLAAHVAACQRRVPGFDALPVPIQVACVDIDYNVGDIRKFPHMLACIAACDWAGASEQSNRPQLPARSKATKALILSAAGPVT
jgi:GH24 family phage-related lysozyme (muramidase)